MSFVLAAMAARVAASDSSNPEQWLKEAEAAYGNLTSYTAIFHKQQRVAGKLLPEETILIKYKKPCSLYMRWVRAPYTGSELLYVEGWNGNRIRAHRGGILRFITRNLDPSDPALMVDNLRPVTGTGIGFLLETVAINIRKAIAAGELVFSEGAEETVYGRKTQLFDVVFGTYYMPKGRLPQAFGLKNEVIPESFWRQLAYPFRRERPRLPVSA